MQQVLITFRFHATGAFERVIGVLFGVSVLAACKVIHKVLKGYRETKRKFPVIPWKLGRY